MSRPVAFSMPSSSTDRFLAERSLRPLPRPRIDGWRCPFPPLHSPPQHPKLSEGVPRCTRDHQGWSAGDGPRRRVQGEPSLPEHGAAGAG